MLYSSTILNDPFVKDLYKYLLSSAPLNYLEYTTNLWEEDIYFILNAKIPIDKYDISFLAGFEVDYTNH